MATHSSVLAWWIPGMVEPGGLPSMGSHRVGHDWSDLAAVAAAKRKLLKNSMLSCRLEFEHSRKLWNTTLSIQFIQRLWQLRILKSCKSSGELYIKTFNKHWLLIQCVTQLLLTLCDPMDCSPPGSSVHGIFQARILEWVATSYSRGPF